MRELTEHEQRLEDQAREQAQRAARRTERQDLRRLCPVNSYLDVEHLADLMHQGPSGNRPFLLWRHFAAVGMRYEGFTPDTIAAAMELHGAELDQVLAPLKPWEVPGEVKRRFPLLYPELVQHEASAALSPSHPREEYPIVGPSGWRTSSPIEPGPRRSTLAGG